MGMGMAEFVKNMNYKAFEREELERRIDMGSYHPDDKAFERFYRPPFAYTELEPKSWPFKKGEDDEN